ncbi:MAG: helix-turn-helix transcriptional regulator [Rudaea sp.]|nr:helix-turn-helix transcriptional regulator [Rudaea sp.]
MGKVADKSANYALAPRVADGFGQRFGKVADLVGLRAEVAQRLKLGVSTLQRYVAAESMPPFDVAARLCELANVRMEWLATNKGPMYAPESFAIPARESQHARQGGIDLDAGLHSSAVRITNQVLKKYGLLGQLSSDQFSELVRIVYFDLARGAADDAAVESLARVLAINRKP